jgi:hypothetical protein
MRRKFFYQDVVAIKPAQYPRHQGHTGVVTHTRITSSEGKIIYDVQCECGSLLKPRAVHMDLVSQPHEAEVPSIPDMRLRYFEGIFGEDADLECLDDREKKIILFRYGLSDEGNKTLRELGEMFGVHAERIRQIQKRITAKLAHAH